MKISYLFAKKHLLFFSATLFAFQLNARADEDAPSSIQIHGFSTLGYSRILQEQQVNGAGFGIINKSGTTLYNSLLGLNLSYAVNDQVTFYGQLTGSGTSFFQGSFDAVPYSVKIDMAMLNYHPFDWIDIRVGRQIVPVWMESEQIDVGVTYPWIRPPMEVYNLAPIKSSNGIGVDLKHTFLDVIDATFGVRYGDAAYDSSTYTQPVLLSRILVSYLELNYNNMLRLRSSYGTTRSYAVRSAVSEYYTDRSKASSIAPGTKPDVYGNVNSDTLFNFYSFGGTLDWNNFLFMAEYATTSQKYNQIDPVDAGVVFAGPTKATNLLTAWYATAAYHWYNWTPHFTYSRATKIARNDSYDNINNATFNYSGVSLGATGTAISAGLASSISSAFNTAADQHTIAFGTNFNFTPTIVAKAQFEQTRTNNAQPTVNFLNSPSLSSDDIINIGEVAVSFVF